MGVPSSTGPQATLGKALANVPYVYKFCQELRLPALINEIIPPNARTDQVIPFGELITALVVNRLTDPRPLYRVAEWARESGLEYYSPASAEVLNDDRLARALDRLEPYCFDLQEAFILELVARYEIDPAVIHYDITSIYFEGEYEQVEWITLGYSRDQKPNKVQTNLALNVTDAEALPVLWSILPGNTNDTSTVIENLNRLKTRFPRVSIIHIGDRAMFSLDIYRHAHQAQIDLVAPLKNGTEAKMLLEQIVVDDLPLVRYEEGTTTIHYRLGEYELALDPTGALPPLRALVVWSKNKAEQEGRQREKKITQRRQALTELQTKLNQPYYRTKKTISKKLTRIMEQDPVNEGFTVVLGGADRALTLEVQEAEAVWEAQSQHDGLYVLVTTLFVEDYDSWTVFDLYKRQNGVEWRFRTLKHPLKIRPLFVHRPERVRALVFIIMLALVIYSVLELVLHRQQIALTPQRLFQRLQGMVLMQVRLPDQSLHFLLSPADPNELALLQALGWQDVREWVLQRVQQRFKHLEAPRSRTNQTR